MMMTMALNKKKNTNWSGTKEDVTPHNNLISIVLLLLLLQFCMCRGLCLWFSPPSNPTPTVLFIKYSIKVLQAKQQTF